MQFLRRLLLWVIIFLILSFVGLYLFIENKGADFFQKQLSVLLKRNVTVGKVRLLSLSSIRFDNLNISGVLQAQRARVTFAWPDFSQKVIAIPEISLWEPFYRVRKDKDNTWYLGETVLMYPSQNEAPAPAQNLPAGGGASAPVSTQDKTGEKTWTVVIEKFHSINSQVSVRHYSADKEFEILLANANIAVESLRLPIAPAEIPFGFEGTIFTSELPIAGSFVKGHGKADFVKKNLDFQVKVRDEDGKESLSAKMVSRNNDMTVTGKLNIRNLAKKMNIQQQKKEYSSFEDFIISAVQASNVEIGIEFLLKTKMDDIRFDAISFKGNVGYMPALEASGAAASAGAGESSP